MNQNLSKKLERIDAEIKRGLKMKAADRLRNLINQYPNELILLERLAELYYQSGFLDAAGKLWILIEPKEKKIIKCVEIYEKSVNYSGTQILNDIMFRGDKNQLSEYGRKKLSLLEKDSQQKSNYIPRSNFNNYWIPNNYWLAFLKINNLPHNIHRHLLLSLQRKILHLRSRNNLYLIRIMPKTCPFVP